MRDKILYRLFCLGEYKVIRVCYLAYYQLAIKVVSIILRSRPYVQSAYLKGSFGKDYFVPIISDLDFFICGKVTDENTKSIEKIFDVLNKFFPMVSDFDFHNLMEAEYLQAHAGIKFAEVESWTPVKGSPLICSYKYHPRKFNTDIVHEIYFQLEWLFKNLRNRKNKEKFVTICIQRQYQKIKDLLQYFSAGSEAPFKNKKVIWEEEWFELSNEEIINKFNHIISQDKRIQTLTKLYQEECADINLNDVLGEEYYRDELVVIDEGEYQYSGKNHYFNRNLFELFFFIGCIDSYMILDWINKSDDEVGRMTLKSLYYSRLIERRANFKHGISYFYENMLNAVKISKKINTMFKGKINRDLDLFESNVFVIPLWMSNVEERKEIKNFLVDAKKNDWAFKIVIFEFVYSENLKQREELSSLCPSKFEHVQLGLSNKFVYSDLQKQKSLKHAINWCFGAKSIISWDYHIKIPGGSFIKELTQKLNDKTFVVPYKKLNYLNCEQESFLNIRDQLHVAKPFIWAAKKRLWDQVQTLIGHSADLYNNEFFYYSLTGDASYIPDTEKVFHSSLKALRLKDYIVTKLDLDLESGYKLNEYKDFNFKMYQSIFFNLLRSNVQNDMLGLWLWSGDMKDTIDINSLLENLHELKASDHLYHLNNLAQKELANFGQFFYLYLDEDKENTLIGHNGAYGICRKKSDGIEVISGSSVNCKSFLLHYRINIKEKYKTGLYRISFKVTPQFSYESLSIEAKLKPNGVECENPVEDSSSISDSQVNMWAELSPETTYLMFEAKLNLLNNSSYKFIDWQFNKLEASDEETYFRKIENTTLVGELTRGKYRLVINLKNQCSGSLTVSYGGKKRMPSVKLENSNIAILYVLINEVKRSDVEVLLSDKDQLEVASIDIFKF